MLRVNFLDCVKEGLRSDVLSGNWKATWHTPGPLVRRIILTTISILIFLVVHILWILFYIVIFPFIGLVLVAMFCLGRKTAPTRWYSVSIPVDPQEYDALRLSLLDSSTPEIREGVRSSVAWVTDTLCVAPERTARWAVAQLAKENIPARIRFVGFSRPNHGLILKPTEFNGPISTLIASIYLDVNNADLNSVE